MPQIDELLHIMVKHDASDLHLTSTFKPHLRVDGDIRTLNEAVVLTPELVRELLYEIMPAKSRAEFEASADVDFAYALAGVGRFRVNVFMDRYGVGGVFRCIPEKIPTLEELEMPQVVRDFCYLTKGLVVVTGPTGCGKSTTLAAMIDFINRHRSEHLITIEDPIEFVYTPRRCLINQREVYTHTRSFASALRAALREDPDIVLVGEMRDLETMEIAIETAETGHLVLGTLHTNTAPTTVNRIIDEFPAARQNQIRAMLADSLRGVIAQTLCRKKTGGRVAALEILVVNSGIASNIRDGKTHQIPSAIQIGKGAGMVLFNDSLMKLVTDGVITPKEAYLKAVDKDSLLKSMESAGITVDLGEGEDPAAPGGAPGADPTNEMAQRIQQMRAELARNPHNVDALNNLAWVLGTTALPEFQDAAEAVQLAEKASALAKHANPAVLDTLSAAYASAGRFDKAQEAAAKGLELAEAGGNEQLVASLRRQIDLYRAGQPVRA